MRAVGAVLLLALAVAMAGCPAQGLAAAAGIQVDHYPMTVDDFAPYMPPEYLKTIRAMSPEEQRVWAWKQTDAMIAKGLIKRQPTWKPFSEAIASVADDFVPGAGKVVRQVVQDTKELKADAKQLVNDPSLHNLAQTVKSAADIPINAQAGTRQVLKDNADRVLDRNNLSALKPIAHGAIDAGVNMVAPVPGAVTVADKVSGFVADHTDSNDKVLVCSIGDSAAQAPSSNGAAAKSLLAMRARMQAQHAVDAEAEALWLAGVIPKHTCHYIPSKSLKARGFSLPSKPSTATKPATLRKALKHLDEHNKRNGVASKATGAASPELKAALKAYGAKTFKLKFDHPALRGLGAVASPATKAAKAPKAGKAPKANKANKASKAKRL